MIAGMVATKGGGGGLVIVTIQNRIHTMDTVLNCNFTVYRVTEIRVVEATPVSGIFAKGADTVILPEVDAITAYAVSNVPVQLVIVAPFCIDSGSEGIPGRYFPKTLLQRIDRPELLILVEDDVIASALMSPLLSTEYCPIALRIAFTLLSRWALFACRNCRAGLMATSTIPARIAMIPITMRISMSVKP